MTPALAVWTPDTGTHELAIRYRGAPLADVPTAVLNPFGTRPAVTRYVHRPLVAEMAGHVRASWRQANLSVALLVAAGTGLLGSRVLDVVAAVLS